MGKKIFKKSSESRSASGVRLFGGAKKFLAISLPYIFSFSILALFCSGVVAYALSSNSFELKEIRFFNYPQMNISESLRFCGLRSTDNIVKMDLNAIKNNIINRHPEFKDVKVRRVLPDRLEIHVTRRAPAAQIMILNRYIPIDNQMVLLQGSASAPYKNLTLIEGVKMPKKGLFVGVVLDDLNIKKAMALAEAIVRFNILRGHQMTKIDISDPKNIFFVVDSAIEVRMGSSHFVERLKILDQTLKVMDLDPAKISYIDLRFDDVVVGPR